MSNSIQPLISIVVSSYNRADLLAMMIDSAIEQTYTNWELIIVDDGSLNEQKESIKHFLKNDKRIHFYNRKAKINGAQACRNEGFEYSKGDFVVFFDSDDLIAPYCLEQRVNFMLLNKDIDFAIFPAIKFNSEINLNDTPVFGIRKDNKTFQSFLRREYQFVVWTNVYRRQSLIDNNIKWDENILVFQDFDFNITSLLNSLTFKYSNLKPDYFWRRHNNDSSKVDSPEKLNSTIYLCNKIVKQFKKYQLYDLYKKDIKYYLQSFFTLYLKNSDVNITRKLFDFYLDNYRGPFNPYKFRILLKLKYTYNLNRKLINVLVAVFFPIQGLYATSQKINKFFLGK